RAGLTTRELPAHTALDDVLARLEAEDCVGKLERTGLAAVKRGDCYLHGPHAPSVGVAASGVATSAGAAASVGASALSGRRNLPGFGASSGSFFFTASRTVIHPPFAPGTAPSTKMRPRSGSVRTTRRFRVVTRSTPRCPGIFLFLKVFPG